MATKTVKCPNCSAENTGLENYCRNCGSMLPASYDNQQMQPPQRSAQQVPGGDKRVAAGICGILLGGLGIHKFIMGYTNEGIIMLVVQIVGWFLCGIPSIVISVIGLIEGIMYLTKTDEEFAQTYIIGRKPWF